MAFEVRQGTLSIDANASATDTLNITTTGITAELIIFMGVGRTEATDTVGAGNAFVMFGFADGGLRKSCLGASVEDNAATMAVSRFTSNNACMMVYDWDGGLVDGQLDINSISSGSFQLIYDDVFSTGNNPDEMKVHWLAMSGFTNAELTHDGISSGDTTMSHTGSWTPDAALNWGDGSSTNSPESVSTSQTCLAIGACSGGTDKWAVCSFDEDGSANSETATVNTADQMICYISDPDNVSRRFDFSSFDTSGLNYSITEGGIYVHAALIEMAGGEVHCGSITSLTSTGDIAETGLGFVPRAIVFFSVATAASASSDATEELHAHLSMGFGDDTLDQRCTAYCEEENVADANVTTAIEYDSVCVHLDPNTNTVDGRLKLKSMDSDGFTLEQTAADTTANVVRYIAFGPGTVTPAPGGGVIPHVLHMARQRIG